jgi:hypothetical protein
MGPETDYLIEYDVPGQGGEKDKVRAWVDAHHREVSRGWRILFLDEAHALSQAAMESLLKDVEEPRQGVAFAFATTEPWKLKSALRSRLLELEVRPLDLAEAVDFLQEKADLEEILYEKEGLILLASVKQGHPRDLLGGLEHVDRALGSVTAENVKAIFAIHHLELLVEYFQALAVGDAEAETSAMQRWHDPIVSKVQAIQALLTSIFYNEILGQKVLLDALVDSLGSARAEIASMFCARLNLDHTRKLRPHWEKLMRFWAGCQTSEPQALQLCLSLFENLVNQDLDNEVASVSAADLGLRSSAALQEVGSAHARAIEVTYSPKEVDLIGDRFLSRSDVREIVNRASFFIQHHGRLMNAAFTIYPDGQARAAEEAAIEVVKQFRNKLNALCREAGEDYANITLFERDVGGVFARVIAHIPQLAGIPNYDSVLRSWCEKFEEDDGGNLVVQMDLNPGPFYKKAMRFHWSHVLSLCASLEEDGAPSGSCRLLDDLQVRRRPSGPISGPVLEFSGALRAKAIENACAYHMVSLSAFDAKAWGWIRSGWELKEHADRQQEVDIRQQELAKLDRLWAGDHDRYRIEREKRMNEWAREADSRPRSWVGWWAE